MDGNEQDKRPIVNSFSVPRPALCGPIPIHGRSEQVNEPMQLTLEQQFSLRSFETQVNKMSREQAQEFLVKLYEQMMMRETMYKHFLKHEWNIH